MLLVRYLSTANVRVAIFHISPISWVIAVSSHVTTENALGAIIGAIFVNRKCSWCDICRLKMLLVRYLSTENALGAIIGAMFVNRKCSLRAIFVDRNALAEGTWSGHVAGHMRQQSQSCGIALVTCKVCDSCHLQSLRI